MDKLSEIRDLEEDECKEKETEEKERKQREEQLSAIKNPRFEVRRRTIRRMLRFQAHNPKERVKSAVDTRRRKWWPQLSLPHFIKEEPSFQEFRRSTSTPHESLSSPSQDREVLGVIEEEGEGAGGEVVVVATPKKRKNPLSLVKNPSSYLEGLMGKEEKEEQGGKKEKRKEKKTGLDQDNPVPTATSIRLARIQRKLSPPPVIMEERDQDSVFSYDQPRDQGGWRQSSLPHSMTEAGPGRKPPPELQFMSRTQSLPSNADKVSTLMSLLLAGTYFN